MHLLGGGSVLGTRMLLGTQKQLVVLRLWGGVFFWKKKFFFLLVCSFQPNEKLIPSNNPRKGKML